ncbi:MAG: uroporphyrinogen decarboxylase, partial [Eubacterium sp.]|nr:uroporphyrinogen decarboxylase [Eubacterium sp.]
PDDCADFIECKEKYGDQTTLIGAVAPTTVTVGTEEALEAECKANIDAMAKGGGFMLASGCELISTDAFPNAKKMVEIAETYGVYQK